MPSAPTSRSSTRLRMFIPAPSSFRPCTSARAQWSRRARVSGASPCSERVQRSQPAESWRTPSWALARVSAPTRSIVGSVVGADAEIGADCELRNLAVVGPGAVVGARNVLDHGLRVGAGQRIPDEALRFS